MTALPEPLLSLASVASSLSGELAAYDAAVVRHAAAEASGNVPPASVEAIRVELTYHSNAIEGNTLTLRDTQLVLEGRTPTAGKSLREVYEARNHDRALHRIEGWAKSRPARWTLSEADLLAVHADVLADVATDDAGRYRAGRVLITGTRFVPPGPHRFAELLPASLDLAADASVPAILRAAELHYNLVAVHPFADGNGRTARLAMNAVALSHGLPLIVVAVEDRPAYLTALDEANAGNPAPFAALVLRSAAATIRRLIGD